MLLLQCDAACRLNKLLKPLQQLTSLQSNLVPSISLIPSSLFLGAQEGAGIEKGINLLKEGLGKRTASD